jgi:hypothetical protein
MRNSRKLVSMAAVAVLATAVGGIVAPVAPAHRGVVEIRYTETA